MAPGHAENSQIVQVPQAAQRDRDDVVDFEGSAAAADPAFSLAPEHSSTAEAPTDQQTERFLAFRGAASRSPPVTDLGEAPGAASPALTQRLQSLLEFAPRDGPEMRVRHAMNSHLFPILTEGLSPACTLEGTCDFA